MRKIFIDAPRQYISDLFERDPDFFRYQGLIIYEGRQGSEKTSTMIHDTMLMQKEYPLAKCITNLSYKYQNDDLKHWKKLVNYKNGINGVIAVLDELQNWFSSNQSKNFPPEMLQTITQNRKNRRIIMGTAQSFNLLAKAIRIQCTEVRKCVTFLGCITFVRKKEPYLDREYKEIWDAFLRRIHRVICMTEKQSDIFTVEQYYSMDTDFVSVKNIQEQIPF